MHALYRSPRICRSLIFCRSGRAVLNSTGPNARPSRIWPAVLKLMILLPTRGPSQPPRRSAPRTIARPTHARRNPKRAPRSVRAPSTNLARNALGNVIAAGHLQHIHARVGWNRCFSLSRAKCRLETHETRWFVLERIMV